MTIKAIGAVHENSSTIRSYLASIPLTSIRQILPDRVIEEACRQAEYCYRNRLITPIVTVLHMLLSAIWPEESFNASWQVLWSLFKSRHPETSIKDPSRGTVANARNRLPLKLWKHLFEWISQQAQHLSEPWAKWRDHRVVLVDGTCVSMPDAPKLLSAFGTQNGLHGKARYPLGRLVTFSLAQTMTVISYALSSYRQDENSLAEPLLKTLQKGDLLLADRHFAGANLYARYQQAGLEFLTRVHQRLNLSGIKRLVEYGNHDFVGRLKIGKIYRHRNPMLPRWIRVRFIRSRLVIRGRMQTIWLVTSLLDAEKYPAVEIGKLYARRWSIETFFKELKIELSADVLRSRTPEGIHKELASRMVAINVVRSIMLQAATEHQVDPLRISFVFAVRAILNFAPALATEPIWKLRLIYRSMLSEIAAHQVKYRPGRNEPRMVRREQRHYPRLTTTRAKWRQAYAA